MPDKLTIAIPTYNRPTQVARTAGFIHERLRPGTQLMVVDNHSDTPVRECVPEHISVYRNLTNVGMQANFLKCFELCDTEWLWIASDDDGIEECAIDRVLHAIEQHPEAVIINFRSTADFAPDRRHDFACIGLTDFLKNFESWTHFTWISTIVFNARIMRPFIRHGHIFSYTFISHMVMLILALKEGGAAWLLADDIVIHSERTEEFKKTANEYSWNRRDFELMLGTIFDLPIGTQNRRLLAGRIVSEQLSVGRDLVNLAFDAMATVDPAEARFLMKTKWSRYVRASGSPRAYARYLVVRLGMICPPVLRLALPIVYRLTRHSSLQVERTDWLNRQ